MALGTSSSSSSISIVGERVREVDGWDLGVAEGWAVEPPSPRRRFNAGSDELLLVSLRWAGGFRFLGSLMIVAGSGISRGPGILVNAEM